MINTLDTYFGKQTRIRLVLYSLVLVTLVWLVDYGTGPFLSASIFYLAPITFATWWVGRKTGIALSAISTISWLVTDIFTNTTMPNPFIPYWNAAVRFGFFLIVTVALSYLRQARQRQEELMAFVVHDLRSPLSSIIMGLICYQVRPT